MYAEEEYYKYFIEQSLDWLEYTIEGTPLTRECVWQNWEDTFKNTYVPQWALDELKAKFLKKEK